MQAALEEFRRLVLEDFALQEELRAQTDRAQFIARVVALGRQHGCVFAADDVANALQASRREWNERWIR